MSESRFQAMSDSDAELVLAYIEEGFFTKEDLDRAIRMRVAAEEIERSIGDSAASGSTASGSTASGSTASGSTAAGSVVSGAAGVGAAGAAKKSDKKDGK
jgi:hypothetical protein